MATRPLSTRNAVSAVILALAVIGSALLLNAWMGAVSVAPGMNVEYLRIADVEFKAGCLKLTVRNDLGGSSTHITAVSVNQTLTTTLPYVIQGRNITRDEVLPGFSVACDEPVDRDRQVSIIVDYDWTPFTEYKVGVRGWGNWFFLKVFAPGPLENPFNHPPWHKPTLLYEYW